MACELDYRAGKEAGGIKSMNRKKALAKAALCFVLLVSLSLAWRVTPLRDSVNFETVVAWQRSIKNYPAAFVWVVAIYVMSSLVLFPVTLLNVATIVTFGPIVGNLYALAGWLFSATIGFGIGRVLGRDWVQKIARSGFERLLHRAGRHGFLTVFGSRMVPVAPFTVVNLFVGASGIGFGAFFLATALGRIPGIITLALFGVQLEMVLRRQDLTSWLLFAVTLLTIALATAWSCKRFVGCKASEDPRAR
jgi:phospholipase D1/2